MTSPRNDSLLWNDCEVASTANCSPVSTAKLTPQSISTPQFDPPATAGFTSTPSMEPPLRRRRLDFDSMEDVSFIFNDFTSATLSDSQCASQNSPSSICCESVGMLSDSQCSSQNSDASLLLGSICCESRCLATLSLLELESCRNNFQKHTKMEQQQFLLDTLSLTASRENQCNSLTLAGKHLCKKAFIRVLNISEKRLRNTRNLYLKEGATISLKGLRRERPKTSKHSTALAWMEHYFNRIGDKMPHVEQIHLPHFLSKKMVYELMVQDVLDQGICRRNIISSSHFYALWRQEYRNCIIPKV